MKLLVEVVKKDIRELLSQTKSFLSMILSPILLVIIFGSIFSSPTEVEIKSPIPIGLCNFDRSIPEIIEETLKRPWIQIEDISYEYECNRTLISLVRKGRFRAGIVIPPNFSRSLEEGKAKKIELYIDESVVGLGGIIRGYFGWSIYSLSRRTAAGYVSGILERLKEINDSVSYAQKRVFIGEEEFKNLETYLDFQKNKSIETRRELRYANKEVDSTIYELDLIEKNITEAIKALWEFYYSINCDRIPLEECSNIVSIINTLEEYKKKVSNKKDSLIRLRHEINVAEKELEVAEMEIDEYKPLLSKRKEELLKIQEDLLALQNELGDIATKNPESLLSPVDLTIESFIPAKTMLGLLFPTLLASLVMLISLPLSSLSIVREKKHGTLVRNIVSPIPLVFFILSKIISIVAMVVFQIVLFFLIGFLFFGLRVSVVSIPYLFLYIVLVCSSFVSIGMFIAISSDSESMALLLSSSLILPMIFLSGSTLPFELMPGIMKSIGNLLPLTHANSLFRSLIIYNIVDFSHPFVYLLFQTLLMLSISTFLLHRLSERLV